jgi:pilus assembly protein CpaC
VLLKFTFNEGEFMRTHRRPIPQAQQRAWCRTLLTLAVGASAVQVVPAQTTVPVRVAATAPAPARAEAVAQMSRAVTPVYPTAPCGGVDIAPVVQVSVGKSTVIKPANPITRILLGNPENSRAAAPKEPNEKTDRPGAATMTSEQRRPGVAELDILLLSPTEVFVLGKSIGSTNVVLLDQAGRCTAFDVVVGMDTAALQTVIGQLLPEEKGVRVSSAYDSIVLTGAVTDAGAVVRVLDLANAFVRVGSGSGASVAGANPRIVNMLSTGAPQQVMLEVKVAEVSKALLDQFGINFARAYVPGDGSMVRFLSGIFGGGIASLGQISGANSAVPFSSVDAVIGGNINGSTGNGVTGGSFTGGNVTRDFDPTTGKVTYTTAYGTVPGRNMTNGTLNMQRNDGMVKVLAEPNVMAISGQEGRFNAGGKIFIPVAQRSEGGGSTITLEEKEFGVSVRFRPTVLDAGRINLEMVTEVSELNREGVGISAPGVTGLAVLPSFTSRKTSTTVQLIDGQSFAVGGLIKNNTSANVKAFPVLGELPIVGALFRSTDFQSDKSELVFVITPRLVKPLPANYVLPTDNYREPSRNDLILHGRIEARPDASKPEGDVRAVSPATPATPAAGGFEVK